jgi:hypothetical protein
MGGKTDIPTETAPFQKNVGIGLVPQSRKGCPYRAYIQSSTGRGLWMTTERVETRQV